MACSRRHSIGNARPISSAAQSTNSSGVYRQGDRQLHWHPVGRVQSKVSTVTANPDEALSIRLPTVYNWLPIFDRTLSDVLAWHWTNAIRLHPVYVPEYHKDGTAGGYLRRFSCRVCIFSTDADLVAIHQHDRDAFDAVTSLERKLKFTMRSGASLVEIVEAHTSKHAEEARQQKFCF